MTDRVYITAKLERQLEQMAQLSNAPAVAAQRARQIIDSLIGGYAPVPGCTEGSGPAAGAEESDRFEASDASAVLEGPDPVGAGLLRYRKDKRVKNSLKFNLGQGFRLICIKEKKEIYVMFLGDHDSSSAWLDRFTRKRPHKAEMTMEVFSVDPEANESKDPPSSFPGIAASDEDPHPLPKEVPQEMLRKVFRGLCAPG